MTLEQKVGLCDVVKTAKRWASSAPTASKLQEFETFTLGINEMDPVTVATAYAAIGARGKYCTPMAITEITDRDGKITTYKPKCKQVARRGGRRRGRQHPVRACSPRARCAGVGGIGRDAAGKTGTTDDYAAAWFAGFTPDLAGAVSLGDPRGAVRYHAHAT